MENLEVHICLFKHDLNKCIILIKATDFLTKVHSVCFFLLLLLISLYF